MSDELEVKELKSSLIGNCPTLFLGAGFSRDAICDSGTMPTGKEICFELIQNFVIDKVNQKEITEMEYNEIAQYKIRELCSCIDDMYGGKTAREKFLTERLKNARAKSVFNNEGFHGYLVDYPWKRIYTVNIDDLVENIYENVKKSYSSYGLKEYIPNSIAENMMLIKLHGDVKKPDAGYIFSKDEYNELITKKIDLGLMAFTGELYSTSDIIFIGASLDEPDFEYYLQLYGSLQLQSNKNKLFFIEPYPSLALKQKAKNLNASIIEWTTEQFLRFLHTLNYAPDEVKKVRMELNYSKIFRLDDIMQIFKKPYESSIYQGFNCSWQDVFESWTFENDTLILAKNRLEELIARKSTTKCFCIYGGSFSGKSTLLKQLGVYLHNQDYEVMEYKGGYINRNVIKKYINKTDFSQYAIIIDNASYYYNEIEKMFQDNYLGKTVVFLCASRIYYHNRKKYYLEGNCYTDFECTDIITDSDAKIIEKKLSDKKYLSSLIELPRTKRQQEILRKRSIVSLIIDLTYGKGILKKLKRKMLDVSHLSRDEIRLLLEIAIFDKADIEYYPMELFNERYGKAVNLAVNIDIKNLKIVDYIRYDDQGISLRNSLFQDEIIKKNRQQVYGIIKELLIFISRYVHEGNNDIWIIVFQSLLKEKKLSDQFIFSIKEIGNLLYELKDYFENISYYWLQLGIYEQQNGDFAKALSHLKFAQHIQPNSFKIKHAIARNYLKFANSQTNVSEALVLFDTGERLIKELIYSKDFYIKKAKPFSISCYVTEKVKLIRKFKVDVATKELCEIRDILNEVYKSEDKYIANAMQDFYKLLCYLGKQSIIRISINSPYYNLMSQSIQSNEDIDVLVESI